jgi:hypothetical protein
MSYAPIYNKLRELEERLAVVEVSPPKSDISSWNTIADASVSEVSQVSGYDNSEVLSEISSLKSELANLFKECSLNSSAVSLLSSDIATKDEVAALAAKGEVFALATKDELATLATKDEVADLNTKFDNIINVLAQLNDKINEAHAKVDAIAAITTSE